MNKKPRQPRLSPSRFPSVDALADRARVLVFTTCLPGSRRAAQARQHQMRSDAATVIDAVQALVEAPKRLRRLAEVARYIVGSAPLARAAVVPETGRARLVACGATLALRYLDASNDAERFG